MTTPADQLPTKKLKLPPGFKVETWASGVLDAREIREGPKRICPRRPHGRRRCAARTIRPTAVTFSASWRR